MIRIHQVPVMWRHALGIRYSVTSVKFVLMASCSLVANIGFAITIRHDVPESSYIALGADPKFETAGLVNGGTTCAVAGGVLISPEWVLTAAHCLPVTMVNQTVKFNLGPDQNNFALSVTADNWFRHSSYAGDVTAGNDFGLIHLPQPIVAVTPVRLFRSGSDLGQTITVVGYGRFGTGITGDNLPRGVRRGANNVIDVYANAVGWSPNIGLFDFDNPTNPADNWSGSPTPLPLEGMVAFNDSGSPWFLESGGLTYAAATTSFRAHVDGTDNSDYGDIGGGTRVITQIAWIDGNHDRTLFWGGSTANWNVDGNWIPGAQPAANNAAVVDVGRAIVNSSGAAAKYVFVDGSGQLDLGNAIASGYLIVRGQGTLRTVGAVTQTSTLIHESGKLSFNIGGTTPGSGYDQLNVVGTATVGGTLEILVNAGGGSYTDPTTRGQIDSFTILTASDLVGTFASVVYDGTALTPGPNYFGVNQNGSDGLFRRYLYASGATDTVFIRNYLALPGDANGDYTVDGQDFLIWNQNKFQTGTDWSTGDFNGDGITDGQDFILWNTFKFQSVAPAPLSMIPEPSSCCGMLSAALYFLAAVRRRRLS